MEPKPPRKPPSKWHAVTVVLQTSSCSVAAMCRSKRFLAGEAPRLPLPGCDHPESCKCTYRHFEDRRTGARRGSDVGVSSAERPGRERRASRGRRARDKT